MSERRSSMVGRVVAVAAVSAIALGVIGGLWGRTPAGNTALVVPFGGGPAVVAGAWVTLTLALRFGEIRPPRLWRGALLSGGAALVASLVTIYLPIVLGGGDVPPTLIAFADALAALLGVLVARLLGYRLGRGGWVAVGVMALAAVALVVLAPGFGAIVNLLLAPLLVALPLALSTTTPARPPAAITAALTGSWLCALIAVVVGVQAGGYLVALR